MSTVYEIQYRRIVKGLTIFLTETACDKTLITHILVVQQQCKYYTNYDLVRI